MIYQNTENCSKLTSFDKIRKLESKMETKKRKELLDTKYKPLIQLVSSATQKDKLDHRLVLQLLAAEFET